MVGRASPPALLAAIALTSVTSAGRAEPVRQVVPYSGDLDLDGEPYTGAAQMRFRVYDTAGEGAAVWEECHPAVRAHGGSFAVRLGQPAGEGAVAAPIGPLLASGVQFWLELSVRVAEGPCDAAAEDWTTLSGRQQIAPAPQSVWAAKATDLGVSGDLTVDGETRLGGGLDVEGDVVTRGNLRIARGNAPAAGEPFGYVWPLRVGFPGELRTLGDGGSFQSEHNGAPSNLHLNHFGGQVIMGGAVPRTDLTVHGWVHSHVVQNNAVRTGTIEFLDPNVRNKARGLFIIEEHPLFDVGHGPGHPRQDLGAADGTRICFVARAGARDLDGDDEVAVCQVMQENGRWVALAINLSSSYTTYCQARCLAW